MPRLVINKATLRKYSNLDVTGYGEMIDNLNNVLDKTSAENLKGVFREAGEVLRGNIRQNLAPHSKTGRLESRVFINDGKPDKPNVIVGISSRGPNKGDFWSPMALEYGTSKQQATPVFRPAVTASKPEMARVITDGMKKTIEDAAH